MRLLIVLILQAIACGQTADLPVKTDITQTYILAIGDFIKAGNKKNQTDFDTLYFGKRALGQPDDFPDIQLPEKIEETQIRLISPETGLKMQSEIKSRIYINLMGWVTKEKAEFRFVIFSNGFEHQYDCVINYRYLDDKSKFELEKLQFSDRPANRF